jgi:SPX domain protein involved in polyphosphate accumulation
MVLDLLGTGKYRYERKFSISELTRQEVECAVRHNPGMFSEIYHQRFVNNLYFDSFDMESYFDNIDGSKDRSKFRIRWYGDLFGVLEGPVLEIKIRKGLLGKKLSFPLSPFSIERENFEPNAIVKAVKTSDIPDALKLVLISLEPSLLNQYNRRYYLSADGNYRITIDSEMVFYQANAHNRTFIHKSSDKANTILELKYDQDKDYYADRITSYFPFRITKSSKYADGIGKRPGWPDY